MQCNRNRHGFRKSSVTCRCEVIPPQTTPYIANLAKYLYARSMRTVNIGELKNQLSAYLQYVRNGEEVVVKDRNTPVARILHRRRFSGRTGSAARSLRRDHFACRKDELGRALLRNRRR